MAHRDYPEAELQYQQAKERFAGGLVGELAGARIMSQREAMNISTSTPPDSEIANQINRIHRLLSGLSNSVNSIGQRIAPVCDTDVPHPKNRGNEVAPECTTSLGSTLSDIGNQIELILWHSEATVNSIRL